MCVIRWKLHLRPRYLAASHIANDDVQPLPMGKAAIEVLADFLRYLYQCSRKYIDDSHGLALWESLDGRIEFVLTHPNGWEGLQQKQMREAASLAGLIPDTQEGQTRVHLLTEGEASLHFCVNKVLAADHLSRTPIAAPKNAEDDPADPGAQGVVIIDAGGGTIDLSAYCMKLSPTSFEEIAPAECKLSFMAFDVPHPTSRSSSRICVGHTTCSCASKKFVSLHFMMLIFSRTHKYTTTKEKLARSKFGTPGMLSHIADVFDKTTKLHVRNAEDPHYIKLGTARDKDPECDIRSGQLKLTG